MPINLTEWSRFWKSPQVIDAMSREYDRWQALTPEQRKAEQAEVDARWEKARKHIEFLDYCVAKKIDPNLVLPVVKRG